MIGDVIKLPAVVYRERIALGELFHVLDHEKELTVTGEVEMPITSRTKEILLTLSNGASAIVSRRKYAQPPGGAEYVLLQKDDGMLSWSFNKKLDEFRRDVNDDGGWQSVLSTVRESWDNRFRFLASNANQTSGLRPPQLGALHAIGAHWTLKQQPATVVMPTGTGKTETMLAMLVAFLKGPVLVVVPTRVLREQTANKFKTLGLLRKLGVVPEEVRNPVVAVIRERPTVAEDLEFLSRCHVVVTTIGVVGQGTASAFTSQMAQAAEALVVDEAHHVPAQSWSEFRDKFKDKPIIQFTATPFRRDGKLVDGEVIYEYPLRVAQENGYFKPISFEPIFEIDSNEGDRAIATAAVSKLREDLANNRNHLVMARCDNIDRAEAIVGLYRGMAADLNPILVHSEAGDNTAALNDLRGGRSRIVVCVDMLGEGFDLPQLKIAALHDTHKSLGVILQFTGRFTRSADNSIGNATVIANIANQSVSTALERLYSEDADWNKLLSEFSSEAIRAHRALVDFLRESEPIAEEGNDEGIAVSPQLLRPKFSTVVFRATTFQPAKFFEGLPASTRVHRHWLHRESNTLYFVTRSEPHLEWTRSRDLLDRQWDLFVVHFDESQQLLYIHSSDNSSIHSELASSVTRDTAQVIMGDSVFRSLGKINRLKFQNIGLKKRGRRNLRYAMYTGADVAEALTQSERAGSEKSNLSGDGWEEGGFVTIGCSYKGRVWSREQGAIPEFVTWATAIGAKLNDDGIDTAAILRNVLIPQELEQLPTTSILSVDWPIELVRQAEERIVLRIGTDERPISRFTIAPVSLRAENGRIEFRVFGEGLSETLALELDQTRGYVISHISGQVLSIKIGRFDMELPAYLTEYSPTIRFVDMSELDGNLLVSPRDAKRPELDEARLESWDWDEVDITKESLWHDREERQDSIQGFVASKYISGGFDVVFDDDAPGEAADLVCLKEENEHITLALVHCKFSGGQTAGERVKDVVEVSSQAIRSSKWKWQFRELCKHVVAREKSLRKPYRDSRFLAGEMKEINRFLALSRFKPIHAQIVVVQPGILKDKLTDDQTTVLAAAQAFLKETVDVDLDVICS